MPDRSELDQRVLVGEHRLHARVVGTGTPAVVLDTGMGDSLEAWGELLPRLGELTTTVAYDRAGLGESELGPEPRDLFAVAKDLRALLQGLGIEPPYLLIGHSLGGLHIRGFAHLYPEEVAGWIFIDPTTEGMIQSVLTEEGQAAVLQQLEGESEGVLAEARGVPHRLRQLDDLDPPPHIPAVVLSAAAPMHIPEEHREAAAAAGMTEERLEELLTLKLDLHRALADKLPQSEHITLPENHHYLHQQDPEIVVEQVRKLLGQIRRGQEVKAPVEDG
ncbi:MAG: alpha/beta hydrolase [Acidobacteriota bacterium]|nr:alpha/beta hydrolase [Acidobacteriota bacterium]